MNFKKVLKIFFFIVIFLIAAFAGFLIYASATDYKPEEKIIMYESDNPDTINDTLELSIMIWNIAYLIF